MNIARIEAAVEAYRQGAPENDAARLDFFAGLFRLQQERADELAAHYHYELAPAEDLEGWYWSGTPILSQAPVALEPQTFAQTLRTVTAYLGDNSGIDDAAASALAAYGWEQFADTADLALAGADPSAFIDSCLASIDDLGVSPDLPANVFMMVPLFALRSHLQGAAEAVMGAVDAAEGRRIHDNPVLCPVCGSPAAASLVGEAGGTEGKGRMQYCATCGANWPYERIRCGMCGELSPSKLHYFHVEGDAAHRLQSCDACGRYQRVVFQDELGGTPPCMEVEDVVMARLDKIALDPRFRMEASA